MLALEKFCPSVLRRAAAFTMVELLIGLLLFGIVFAALCRSIAFSVSTARVSRENLRASQILVEKMEYMRLFTWSQITNGSIPGSFTEVLEPGLTNSGTVYKGQIKIEPVPLDNNCSTNMRLVTVSLVWTSKVAQSRQMQTFVSRNGLQQYVY
jgi:type II secretory pathway pseudopilin PulG